MFILSYWKVLYFRLVYLSIVFTAIFISPNTIPQQGIPQQADYVTLNVERHDGEPTVYLTMGGGMAIYCNVLHAEPRPEIPLRDCHRRYCSALDSRFTA